MCSSSLTKDQNLNGLKLLEKQNPEKALFLQLLIFNLILPTAGCISIEATTLNQHLTITDVHNENSLDFREN